MTPTQVAKIMALAKECGAITYTHRSSPHEAAVSFGPIAWAKFVEAALLAPQAEGLADSFVQRVPDKCDRIVWRNIYYHLPLAATPSAPQQAEPPYAYIYEWDGPFGVHQSTSSARYNGMAPNRSIPVYLAATPSAPAAVEPDERAEFEAWINRGERSPLTVKDDRGGYLDTPTHFRWTGWQARASKGTK